MKLLTLPQIEKQYESTLFRRINIGVYVLNLIGSYVLSEELSKTIDISYAGTLKETSNGGLFFTYLVALALTSTVTFLLINTLITIAENGKVTNHLLLEAQKKETEKQTQTSPSKSSEPLSKDDPWYYKY